MRLKYFFGIIAVLFCFFLLGYLTPKSIYFIPVFIGEVILVILLNLYIYKIRCPNCTKLLLWKKGLEIAGFPVFGFWRLFIPKKCPHCGINIT